MNKRGQEGTGLGTLFAIVLGAIAVILVGYLMYNYFGKVNEVPGALPSALTVAAQACKLSADNNDRTGYCSDFKEAKIAGVTNYMNCDYIKTAYDTEFEQTTVECSSDQGTNYCDDLNDNPSYDGKAVVNGVACEKAEAAPPVNDGP